MSAVSKLSVMSVAVVCLTLAQGAGAQTATWTGPDPQRKVRLYGDTVYNLDYVMSEICMPWVIQEADTQGFKRSGVVAARRSASEKALDQFAKREVLSAWWVGSPNITVTLSRGVGKTERNCDVTVNRGEGAKLRDAMVARLAQWPHPLTQKYSQPVTNYAQRELWCGTVNEASDLALISSGGQKGFAALRATVWRQSPPHKDCPSEPAAP
ncbi:MAG: hypothetical protein LDL37_07800 [Asticcacaulis sp.]|uniref:hypothetical protein n=1 Tax=Asticcacaulis sp. TaxID=1872648 RepID=UPI0025BA0D9D|nr:hypothetical protein [Asticcacaulis sp.]MCA1935339.1 hypothetical protein [Asticcacaulis sp.]